MISTALSLATGACHDPADPHQRARIMAAALRDVSLRPVRFSIDWGCVERVTAYAEDRRAALGEVEWARLQKEWDA